MRSCWKGSLTVGALAIAVLAIAQMASAQAPRASDKARGYYGPAASPGPDNAIWLEPGVTGREMWNTRTRARSFSYAPAPVVQQAQPAAQPAAPAAPRAQAVQPAPAARPAPTVSVAPRRYSYQPMPVYRGYGMDRVLGTPPANRNAAAKALGEY
jgi:hypothetical protein